MGENVPSVASEEVTSSDDPLDFFIAEECTSSNEAKEIADHFRDIISTIQDQIHGPETN